MNVYVKIIYFFSDILLPLAMGYLIRRFISEKTVIFDRMIKWNILFLIPLLSLISFWIIDLRVQLIWLPVLGVVMQVVPGAAGFFRARKKYKSSLDQGGYILSAMLSNRGIVGMISVFILYGEEGYALVRLVMLFAGFVLYLVCFPMARHLYSVHEKLNGEKPSIFRILFDRNQAPVLGILAGIILNYGRLERPAIFGDIFPVLIHIVAWLYILPIGHSLDVKQVRFHLKGMSEILLIKFILTPLITYLCALSVGLEGTSINTVFILSMAPTAINALITAKIHKLNFHLAMSAYLLTTAVYLFLLYPLIFILFTAGVL
jgi:predicted permease